MRRARRDTLISAAQVAYSYGAYTLDSAIALSRDERELLVAVALTEEERLWRRFERSLGISWDIDDLTGAGESSGPVGPVQLPRTVRIPLAVAAAPDFFQALAKEYKAKYSSMLEAQHVSGGAKVTEISTLSAADARALLTKIGPALAAIKPGSDKE